jgi:hypothetical protein
MFLYLLANRNNINVFYHIRDKKLIYYLEKKFSFLKGKLIYTNSLRAIWNILRAEYIFTDCDFYDIASALSYQPGNFNIINLWHGDPIKKIGLFVNNNYNQKIILKKLYTNYYNNIKL